VKIPTTLLSNKESSSVKLALPSFKRKCPVEVNMSRSPSLSKSPEHAP